MPKKFRPEDLRSVRQHNRQKSRIGIEASMRMTSKICENRPVPREYHSIASPRARDRTAIRISTSKLSHVPACMSSQWYNELKLTSQFHKLKHQLSNVYNSGGEFFHCSLCGRNVRIFYMPRIRISHTCTSCWEIVVELAGNVRLSQVGQLTEKLGFQFRRGMLRDNSEIRPFRSRVVRPKMPRSPKQCLSSWSCKRECRRTQWSGVFEFGIFR